MAIAEFPRPADIMSMPLSEDMQKRVDILRASSVDTLLEEVTLPITEHEVELGNENVAIHMIKRPSLRIDKTASIGLTVIRKEENKPIEIDPFIRVEAQDTGKLVVSYMDISPKNPREHRWVSLAEHAQVNDLDNVQDYLAVSIDAAGLEQRAAQQDVLRFQIDYAAGLAQEVRAAKKAQPVVIYESAWQSS